MPLSTLTKLACALAAAALMTACGGGKDDPIAADTTSTDSVSKYVGSWESECYADSGASAELRADFSKASATSLGGNVTVYYYIGSSCSGPVVKTDKVLSNLSLAFQGPKTVAGLPADAFSGTSSEGTAKVVLYTSGATLQLGNVKGAVDGEGYATTFYEYTLKRI